MVQKYLLIILSSIFLFACSSGKARLEKGQYDMAVYKAVKRLQQKPNHKKASRVLQEAYSLAVDFHMNNVRSFDIGHDGDKWERMAAEYEQIDYLNTVIRRYPEYSNLVQLVDVTEELAATRLEASKEHVARGLMFMEQGDKASARLAFDEFARADYFVPGDENIIQKMFEAREAGTVNIAIEFPSREMNSAFVPTQDLYFEIQNYAKSLNFQFLRFIDIDHPYYELDEIIQLQFDDLIIGNVYMDRVQEHIIKDGVLLGEERINDSTVVQVKGKVSADFRTFTKTIDSRAVLALQRIDARTGETLIRQRFPTNFNWVGQWATYQGDSRALTQEQLKIAQLDEPINPSRAWIFSQLCKPLFDNTAQSLNRQFAFLR